MFRRFFLLISLLVLVSSAHAATVNFVWEIGQGTTPVGYIMERRSGTAGPYAEIARILHPTMTYQDTTAPVLTPVCWQVRSYNALVASDPSNEVCLDMPQAPINLTIRTTGPSTTAAQPRVKITTKARKVQ